jgi:hypothetical protein
MRPSSPLTWPGSGSTACASTSWTRTGRQNLFVRGRDDTRALDPKQLDTLDRFVAELKKRGIYTNLNLNVGRTFRKGDGVRDHEYSAWPRS